MLNASGCWNRKLAVESCTALAECLRQRLHRMDLLPAAQDPATSQLLRMLSRLVLTEEAIADVIASSVFSRFTGG
jgi:hypothetical protein